MSSLTPETVSEGPGVSRRQGNSSGSRALWATSSCTQSSAARFLLRAAPERGAALLHSWLFSHVWPRWLRNAGRPPVHWPVHRCLEAHLDPVRLKEWDDEPHKRLSQRGFSTERQTRQEPRAQDPPPPHQPRLSYGPAGSPYSTILCPYQSEHPAGHIMREERRSKKGKQGKKKSFSTPETSATSAEELQIRFQDIVSPLFSFHKVVHGPFIYLIRMD